MFKRKLSGHRLQLKSKLIFFVGILLLCTIVGVFTLSFASLNRAYQNLFTAEEAAFDVNIKVAVENMLSVLEVNHQRHLNGELTESEAYDQAVNYLSDVRFNSGEGYFWAYTADGTSVLSGNSASSDLKIISESVPAGSDAVSSATSSDDDTSDTETHASTPSDAASGASINVVDKDGAFYVKDIIAAGDQAEGGYTNYYTEKPGEEGVHLKRSFTMKFEPYGWYINTGTFMDTINTSIAQHRSDETKALIVLGVTSLVISLIGSLLLYKGLDKMTGPLSTVTKRISLLSEGDVQTPPVAAVKAGDEIGVLTRTTESLILHIRSIVLDISDQLGKMSKGDMTSTSTLHYIGDFIPIQEAINEINSSLNQTLRAINMSAEEVNAGSMQVANVAQSLAMGTQEQASTIDDLTSSISHVAGQAEDNAANVKLAAGYVSETNRSVDDGNTHMAQLTQSMHKISTASDQIANITKIMEDIAFQTNILALNASIEASRAGEAGKGFAVVANEVRSLAAKSSEAAQQTGELIKHSGDAVADGTKVASRTAEILREIAEKSGHVNEYIQKIELASSEQAATIERITSGLDTVSSVVQANAATAEECSAASEELSALATRMHDEVSGFKLLNK